MSYPIIALDVDGVLNCHEPPTDALCGQIHADKMARLNRILRETDARIVLSSAWRYLVHNGRMTLDGMEWLLRSHGLIAGRLIGITRIDHDAPRPPYSGNPADWVHANERGRQIAEWLTENAPEARYVVIDDLDLGITEAGHPFVHVDGSVGLTDGDAERAIGILNREG